jgi:hypothetical protein
MSKVYNVVSSILGVNCGVFFFLSLLIEFFYIFSISPIPEARPQVLLKKSDSWLYNLQKSLLLTSKHRPCKIAVILPDSASLGCLFSIIA